MYLASMPDIAGYLQVSYAKVQLSLSVFLLAQGAGQLFWGPVIDLFGRRIPLLSGLVLFAASSFWAGCSDTLGILILSRFLQGLAGALLLVIGFSSVSDVARGTAAAGIFSVLMTVEGLAPIFAPVLGGFVDEYLDGGPCCGQARPWLFWPSSTAFFTLRKRCRRKNAFPCTPPPL